MLFTEEKGNVFEVDSKYYLVHCISRDCAMSAGIAVDFQHKFHLRDRILSQRPQVGDCVMVDKVFNLITKKYYYNKPTYESLYETLFGLLDMCLHNKIQYLAMPKIGCGLDQLSWPKVREAIQTIFKAYDINILIRYL